jgi:hypothetical protein
MIFYLSSFITWHVAVLGSATASTHLVRQSIANRIWRFSDGVFSNGPWWSIPIVLNGLVDGGGEDGFGKPTHWGGHCEIGNKCIIILMRAHSTPSVATINFLLLKPKFSLYQNDYLAARHDFYFFNRYVKLREPAKAISYPNYFYSFYTQPLFLKQNQDMFC